MLRAIGKTWIVLQAGLPLQDAAGRTIVTYKMLRGELPLVTRCCGQNYCYLQDAVGRTTVTYKMLPAELLLHILSGRLKR